MEKVKEKEKENIKTLLSNLNKLKKKKVNRNNCYECNNKDRITILLRMILNNLHKINLNLNLKLRKDNNNIKFIELFHQR
jgi:hypothetical protein